MVWNVSYKSKSKCLLEIAEKHPRGIFMNENIRIFFAKRVGDVVSLRAKREADGTFNMFSEGGERVVRVLA